jgi:hypothetical protein
MTIFGDFRLFSSKKDVFLENQCYDPKYQYFEQKSAIFFPKLGENFKKQ